jgi:anti-sigma regulatory factor (Ser/Thr protein kinase)
VTEIRREFSPSAVAPALARDALDGWLSALIGEDAADDVRAVATELIGNAVSHGGLQEGDKIVVIGTVDDLHDRVHIEIEQPTPLSGVATHPEGHSDEFGMGLRIVDGIATEWGLDEGPPGVVWFEVDR